MSQFQAQFLSQWKAQPVCSVCHSVQGLDLSFFSHKTLSKRWSCFPSCWVRPSEWFGLNLASWKSLGFLCWTFWEKSSFALRSWQLSDNCCHQHCGISFFSLYFLDKYVQEKYEGRFVPSLRSCARCVNIKPLSYSYFRNLVVCGSSSCTLSIQKLLSKTMCCPLESWREKSWWIIHISTSIKWKLY